MIYVEFGRIKVPLTTSYLDGQNTRHTVHNVDWPYRRAGAFKDRTVVLYHSIFQGFRPEVLICSLLANSSKMKILRVLKTMTLFDLNGSHMKRVEPCCAQSLCVRVRVKGRGNSAPEWFAGMQKPAAGLLGLKSSLAQHKRTKTTKPGRRTPTPRRPKATQGHPRQSKATNPGLDPIPSRLVFGPSGIQSESAPPRRHQLIVLFPVLARLRLSCSLPPHSQVQRQFTPVPAQHCLQTHRST